MLVCVLIINIKADIQTLEIEISLELKLDDPDWALIGQLHKRSKKLEHALSVISSYYNEGD